MDTTLQDKREQNYLGDLIGERSGWFIYQTTDANLLKTGCTHFIKECKECEEYKTAYSMQDAERQIDEIKDDEYLRDDREFRIWLSEPRPHDDESPWSGGFCENN